MDTLIEVELTDQIIRQLIWHALAPAGQVMLGGLREALERHGIVDGQAPEGCALTGVSVATLNGRWIAELTYTPIRLIAAEAEREAREA